jgi:hypothetical protein
MPFTVKIEPTANSRQAAVIPNATEHNDGVMTKEQVALLNSGGAGMAIGGLIANAPTVGSVLYVGDGGVLAQDNSNFFWDDDSSLLRLGGHLVFTADTSHSIVVDASTVINTSGGGLNVRAGEGQGTGTGGNTVVQGASGGANGQGGQVELLGGSAGGGNNNGGGILIRGGAKQGAGVDGAIVVGDDVTDSLNLGNIGGIKIVNTGFFTASIGMFGATPVPQPSSTGETAGFTAGVGAVVKVDSTFTGNSGATAYTVDDLVKHLKALGLIQT